MTDQRRKQVAQLIYLASQMEPDRRDAFLARACVGDAELKREVHRRMGIRGPRRIGRYLFLIICVLAVSLVSFGIVRSDIVTAGNGVAALAGKRMADEFASAPLTPLPEPPSMRARPGQLTVRLNTLPAGASVAVDGLPLDNCLTPCPVLVAPGPHTYTFSRSGYRTAIRSVQQQGELALIELEPVGGKLYLQSEPAGATIFVDGVEHEQRAPASLTLAPGTHRIILRLGERREDLTVDTADGQIRHMSIDMR
jgi:hypothetical protein